MPIDAPKPPTLDAARGLRVQSDASLPETFRSAAAAWAKALGESQVDVSSVVLDRYARSTGTRTYRPLAILRPTNTAQVQQIVKIAGEHRIPIHAISKGKNWGYGDAAPPGDQQVVVDLGAMNRIVELNRELGYVVIEPGVTQ